MFLSFNKEDGVDRKEYQVEVYPYPDEEEIEDLILDDKRERHRRMVFEENGGGVDDEKALLHDKRSDVYINEKKALIKGG